MTPTERILFDLMLWGYIILGSACLLGVYMRRPGR